MEDISFGIKLSKEGCWKDIVYKMKERWKCFVNKKNLRKWIICIAGAFLGGMILSMGYAGAQYLREGGAHEQRTVEASDIQCDKVTVEDGNYHISGDESKLTITFPEKTYISKLKYAYAVPEYTKSKVKVYVSNIYGDTEEREITDWYKNILSHSTINIHARVEKIEFDFAGLEFGIDAADFTIDNGFDWNPFLALFLMAVIFLGLYLAMFKRENAKYPEAALFVSILIISTCMLVMEPPTIVGWDEQIHIMNTYKLSPGEMTGNKALDNFQVHANWFSPEQMASFDEHVEEIHRTNEMGSIATSAVAKKNRFLSSIGYVFQILFLKAGLALHLPFYICWLLGKFSNVLLYALGMSVAAAILPIGKKIFSVIAMAPTALFISICYTSDVTVTVFIAIGISIFLKMLLSKEKASMKWKVLFVVCMAVGCMPKAVYAPLMLLGLMIPCEKYESKKSCRIYRGVLILGFLMLMSSFVLPVLLPHSGGGTVVAGDARGGDTSVTRQMAYVLGKPFAYAVVLIRNVWDTLVDYTIGTAVFGTMGYVGTITPPVIFSVIAVVTAVTDSYREERLDKLSGRHRAGIVISIVITIALIWTALYLSFTEVGKTQIAGVQARYYLPFLFLLYVCLQNSKIKCKVKAENYQMAVMLLTGGFMFWQIFVYFILARIV